MARPQTDIEAGRQELLDIAEELVRKRGGVELSMTELAAAAGMSPANLYRFFENKEALLEAAAGRWFRLRSFSGRQTAGRNAPTRR